AVVALEQERSVRRDVEGHSLLRTDADASAQGQGPRAPRIELGGGLTREAIDRPKEAADKRGGKGRWIAIDAVDRLQRARTWHVGWRRHQVHADADDHPADAPLARVELGEDPR